MLYPIKKWVEKIEIPILLILLGLLIVAYIQGSEWNFNPDEIVKRVNWSLTGDYDFSNDFLYPTLPLYIMYGIGKIIYNLGLQIGYSRTFFFSVSRWFSAGLAALSVGFIYLSVRQYRKSIWINLCVLLLAASNYLLAVNAHYAHNDIYQLFFICLALFFFMRLFLKGKSRWYYLGVFCIGLAASCKYTAGILLPAAWLAYFLVQTDRKKAWLAIGLGSIFCFLGYALGTPLALINPPYYFSHLWSALNFQRSFGQLSETSIGLIGQWALLIRSFSPFVFFFFACMVIASVFYLARYKRDKEGNPTRWAVIFCLAGLILSDFPIAQSYNYQDRFFLPMVPFLVILTGLMIDRAAGWMSEHGNGKLIIPLATLVSLVILYSFAMVVSVTLIFKYEPRVAAGNYLRSQIVEGKTLEYTLYPPVIPENYFKTAQQYPLFFKKAADWEKTEDNDQGYTGIESRKPNYLVIDNFTYERYALEDVCQTTPNDCRFFNDLLAEKTEYQLIKTFHYNIPQFLPQVEPDFLNPVIKIYERINQ